MTRLDLISERFSSKGSVTGKTLGKAVANSPLDEAAIVFRETLQNSLDARLDPGRPLDFTVSAWNAAPGQRAALRDDVFAAAPPLDGSIRSLLGGQSDVPLLMIADWGTRGLGGPTRADTVTDEHADFRDFFLNVGREHKKGYGGGTFGLGRGVLFELSAVGSVVAYTRTRSSGLLVSRLMAMAIGDDYDHQKFKYTGRHWWGRSTEDGDPLPVVGEEADCLAALLGLDVFPTAATGTALVVIAPRLSEGLELFTLLNAIRDAALLYAWPHMLSVASGPTVNFHFLFEGREEGVPSPRSGDSPVWRFAEAYERIVEPSTDTGPTSWQLEELQFGRGRAAPEPLGSLSFRHFPPSRTEAFHELDGVIPAAAIALMRKPRIIVRYLPAPQHPHGSETAGVFVADESFEDEFAVCEPVAHDDWLPSKLEMEKFGRNPVKQALDKMRAAIQKSWNRDLNVEGEGLADDGAVGVASMLGGLVASTEGIGPPGDRPGGGGGAGAVGRRLVIERVRLAVGMDGGRLALFDVVVKGWDGGGTLRLSATPRVMTDSGREPDTGAPASAPMPTIVEWRSPDDQVLSSDTEAVIDGNVRGFTVVVRQPDDVAITLAVREVDTVEQESSA